MMVWKLNFNQKGESEKMIKILFVCHGNICRSVAAEYIFKAIVKEKNMESLFQISSRATTTEEEKNDIYPLMKKALTRQHIPFSFHQAKQITLKDYEEYDYIFLMDTYNTRTIRYVIPQDDQHKIMLLSDFVHASKEVDDPWYTGLFDEVVLQLKDYCLKCFTCILKESEKI